MRWIILVVVCGLPAFAGVLESARQEAGRLFAQWKLKEAEALLRHAVDAERRAGGSDPLFPLALNELGTLNHDLGHHLEAEKLYRESVSVGGSSTQNWCIGFPLSNLAGIMIAYGRAKDALEFANRSIEQHTKKFGAQSMEVGMASNARAHALLLLGRLEEAEATAGTAIVILQKFPEGENVGISHYILAEIAWLRRDVAGAESALLRANDIWARTLPDGHPSAITGIAGLGSLKSRTDPQESDRLMQRAISMAEEKLGRDNYFTGTIILLYADKLKAEGRKSEAKTYKKRGDKIMSAYSRENLLHHSIDINAFRANGLK